jgi:hypothetical protein
MQKYAAMLKDGCYSSTKNTSGAYDFTAEPECDQLKSCLQIKSVSINAYSHEENAIVERANKEVNRHLRGICFDRKIKEKWRQSLPLVQRIVNVNQ